MVVVWLSEVVMVELGRVVEVVMVLLAREVDLAMVEVAVVAKSGMKEVVVVAQVDPKSSSTSRTAMVDAGEPESWQSEARI